MANLLDSQQSRSGQQLPSCRNAVDNAVDNGSNNATSAIGYMERIEKSLAEIERIVNSCESMAKEIKSDARQILDLCNFVPDDSHRRRRWASDSAYTNSSKCQHSVGDTESNSTSPLSNRSLSRLSTASQTSPDGCDHKCNVWKEGLAVSTKHQRASSAPVAVLLRLCSAPETSQPEVSLAPEQSRPEVSFAPEQSRSSSQTSSSELSVFEKEPSMQDTSASNIKITDSNSNVLLLDSLKRHISSKPSANNPETQWDELTDPTKVNETINISHEDVNHNSVKVTPLTHENKSGDKAENLAIASQVDLEEPLQPDAETTLLDESEINEKETPVKSKSAGDITGHKERRSSSVASEQQSHPESVSEESQQATSVSFYIDKEDNSKSPGSLNSNASENNNIPKQESTFSFSELLDTVPAQIMSASTTNRKIKTFGNPRNRRTSEPAVVYSADKLTANNSLPALSSSELVGGDKLSDNGGAKEKKVYQRSQSDMSAMKLSSAFAAAASLGGESSAVSYRCSVLFLFLIFFLIFRSGVSILF